MSNSEKIFIIGKEEAINFLDPKKANFFTCDRIVVNNIKSDVNILDITCFHAIDYCIKEDELCFYLDLSSYYLDFYNAYSCFDNCEHEDPIFQIKISDNVKIKEKHNSNTGYKYIYIDDFETIASVKIREFKNVFTSAKKC